jgi:hypothetical protein
MMEIETAKLVQIETHLNSAKVGLARATHELSEAYKALKELKTVK